MSEVWRGGNAIFERSLRKDIATKPRQPTSNGSKWTVHPASRTKSANSEYLRFFRWLAFVIFSSHGHVNSPNMTVFVRRDHIMRSGRSGVSMIKGGTISGTSGRSSRNSQSTVPSRKECLLLFFFGGCRLLLSPSLTNWIDGRYRVGSWFLLWSFSLPQICFRRI